MTVEIEVEELKNNEAFLFEEIATFEGGCVLRSLPHSSTVVKFDDGRRFMVSIQNIVAAIGTRFDRE